MTQTEALYYLQEIDLKILHCQKRLNEIVAALVDNHMVTEAEAQVNTAKQVLTPMQIKARNIEFEAQSNREKAQAAEEQLYSGRVRNPKELQDIQKEIEALKRRHSDLDDILLELMMSIEEAELVLNESQTRLQDVTHHRENTHRDLLAEQAQLQTQLEKLQGERTEALTHVTSENLQIYNNLKIKKHNQPLALMNSGSCTVCGVEQTMAIQHEARSGQKLVYCLSCGRILVYR